MGTGKMDASTVYALFEELKQKIEQLSKCGISDNQAMSNLDTEEIVLLMNELRDGVSLKQFSPEQIKELQNILAQVAGYSLGKVNDNIRTILTELKTIIVPIKEKINLLQIPLNMVIRKEHVFIVDFRRSKMAITIITMALAILLSLSGNIWQLRNNIQARDNNLKYRYIKMEGKASSKDLLRLETIFTNDRDSISVIRDMVESYEQLMKKQVEKIEQRSLEGKKNS